MRIAIEVGGLHAGRFGRLPAGDGDVALEPRDGEAPPPVLRGLPAPAGHDRGDRGGAVPPGRRVRLVRVRQEPCRRVRPDRLRIGLPEAVLPGPVPGRADQRPADGLLPGGGAGQRREAPRGDRPAGRHQRLVVQDDDRMGRPAGLGAGGRRRGTTARTTTTRASRCRRGAASPPGRARSARRPASSRRPPRASAGSPTAATGWGVRLGLGLVKGIGEQHEELLDRGAGARAVPDPGRGGRADRAARGGPRATDPDRRRSIRSGRPRRELLWQLREVAGASRGRVDGRALRGAARPVAGGRRRPAGRWTCACRRRRPRHCPRSPSRNGSAMPTR